MARKDGKDRGIFQRDGVWWVRVFIDGKDRRFRVGCKTVAKHTYQRMKTEQRENRFLPENYQRRRIIFSELADARLIYADAHHSRKGDDKARVRIWKDAFGNTDAATITPSNIERVILQMKADEYEPATINRALVVLKAIYNRAVRDGLLTQNPASKVTLLKTNNELTRYLTTEQEQALLDNLHERSVRLSWLPPIPAFVKGNYLG
jgi:hypothetical protein